MKTDGSMQPHIVVIGGGTGSFTLLQALKSQTPYLTALVNMADDGGSTGVLRDELGVLPPGDVRQCLVALSESPGKLRELFNYRFPEGTFAGHSFGNLFLSAVEKMTDDFGEAVRLASDVLQITGEVVPVTLDRCNLVLRDGQGNVKVRGQYAIETSDFDGRTQPQLVFEPEAVLNPRAREALVQADLIVIAPGNLYSSLVPALMVSGMSEALQQAKAPVAYVCNLVNKPTQTKNFAVHDYVSELERIAGDGVIDTVLYNTDQPSAKILDAYALDGEYPVVIDQHALEQASYTAIGGNFLSHSSQERDSNDTFILRSLIRHDVEAIAQALLGLTRSQK
jgi:uncharacterized cofD-like protein